MKMYLLYASHFGELAAECGATTIIGLYKTREQAERERANLVEEDRKNGYILDEQINEDYLCRDLVTIFYGHQENWNCYYELIIEEIEVK